jgi:hypothetical protein
MSWIMDIMHLCNFFCKRAVEDGKSGSPRQGLALFDHAKSNSILRQGYMSKCFLYVTVVSFRATNRTTNK